MVRTQKKIFITEEGLKKIEEELKYLKEVRRGEITQKLKRSLEFGDLSENAEYQEAKEDQAFVEARIAELEEQLKNIELIKEKSVKGKDGKTPSDTVVQIGSTVKLKNITDDDPPETYTIVGSAEADPLNGRISNESPIGSAILDKKKGDIIKVKVPAGEYEYKILEIN